MTTDFRALCAELVDDLELCDWPYKLKETIRADIERARAALAEPKPLCRYIYNPSQIAECGGPCEQGPKHCDCGELWIAEPAAPEGRESAYVTEQPSDDELLDMHDWMTDEWAADHDFELPPIQYARAVLARWGNLPESPDSSDGPAVPEGREPASVIEQPTVMQLIELSDEIEAAGLGQVDFARAVLARWGNPAPQLPDTND